MMDLKKLRVEQVPSYFRLLDYLMIPIMWILSGFKNDSPQETHHWHMQEIDPNLVPDKVGIAVMGDDKSKFKGRSPIGLNHMPIFGGWTNYVILQANGIAGHWHVGWKVKFLAKGKKDICEIHKLKIYDDKIKVFKGINDSKKIFFGLDEAGKFIPLKIVGKGTLGDGKFNKVRLF